MSGHALVAALGAGAIGALVLVGWAIDSEICKRILPGVVAMNPLTAVTFLLAALCLRLCSRARRDAPGGVTRWTLRLGAGLIATVGALKLAEIVGGFDIGIDRWLFASKLAVGSAMPNRMAPNTAFNFALVGCAFLFLQARNRRVSVWACIFALVSGFEALLAVLGYAYRIESLYGIGSFIPMAPHTAVAFLLVAYGIMARQAERGFLGIITGGNVGGAMARRLLPAAILVPALLGWLRLEGQRRGFYNSEFGVALYTVTNMVVFGSIICCNALSLFRTDAKRTKAERRLRRAHHELEARVEERTAELSQANAALLTARDELEERVRERTATLAESEARLHAILDNGTSVVYLKDMEGRYLLVNRCFAKLLGRTKEEIIGRKTSDLYPAEAAEQFRKSDLEALQSDAPIELEESALQEDGLHTFVSTKFPLRDSAGEIYALCGVAHDISERVAANQALREAESEAHRANRAKSEFLSRMSHELRTPMNAILGFAQILELDELNEDQRDGVGHILRGGRHLLELINEVLDISRIEAGHLSLSPEPVEIGDAIRETLNLVQPLASAREVRLNPAPACAAFVRADRQRVKQVLINLLSNAIKYNRLGGSVTISCEEVVAGRAEAGHPVAGRAEAGPLVGRAETGHAAGVSAPGYNAPTRLRVSITDTGIGIPAERLQMLFVPFERLGAEQSAVEGTGLGLAVAKRLAEAMDGTMGVESSPGQGSTFWVEFPLTESPRLPDDAAEQSTASAMPASSRPCTVLYVEDNLSNLRLIERVLERRPHIALVAAGEGLAGLNMAREQRPDLILLDVNLPDIDGHEVLVRLRGDPVCASIPVLVISADATRGQIERLKNAGASEYLTKPLDVGQFLEALDRTLRPAAAA
jgi:PAS domain S-box-containing protein